VTVPVRILWSALLLGALGCASGPQNGPPPGAAGPEGMRRGPSGRYEPVAYMPEVPPFPDTSLLGTAVLVAARAPDTSVWVGTYGHGLYVSRRGSRTWQQFTDSANDSTAIAWNVVNAVGFTRHAVWYGTVGGGFGRSLDGGKTWQSWVQAQLGPEWQYVAPDGIRGRGDTIFIATADGLRISGDNGDHWLCVRGPEPVVAPASPVRDACTRTVHTLPDEYLLALDLAPDGSIWVGHLHGLAVSRDGGLSWSPAQGVPDARVRAVRVASDSSVWAATETAYYRAPKLHAVFKPEKVSVPGYAAPPGLPHAFLVNALEQTPAIATSHGLLVPQRTDSTFHLYVGSGDLYQPAANFWTGLWETGHILPVGGSDVDFRAVLPLRSRPWDLIDAPAAQAPAVSRHPWVGRPIAGSDNPYIDQTYRYGSTMGGAFQQHQGVEFNDPDGTPVHAVADGTVVYAGPAEAGANTVAIHHDEGWDGRQVFSVYYHNSRLDVHTGQHVQKGDVIALVGNTGRATNDHLHLEIHVAPTADSAMIVNPEQRYPPYSVNPQLWIEPLAGTGVVAGQVLDAEGKPVLGAEVYGPVLPYPTETPFVFAETYRDRAHSDPAYGENFAVGDVPAGRYLVAALIGGTPVWRTVDVAAGKVSWVEFRPAVTP
jgi:murein DD-endopeptidase MepM/ murein hydrolase activator NlpD